MAFANKIGSLLKRAVTSNTASPSMLQAIRSMSSSKLFIGGVSYNTDDMSLKEAFSSHGEVIEARIIMDRETGRSRGFGFVTFNSAEEASAALAAMDGKDLHGRIVRVNYANDRPRGGGFGGGGYGGGGYGGGGYGGGSRGGGYGGNSYNSGGGGYGDGAGGAPAGSYGDGAGGAPGGYGGGGNSYNNGGGGYGDVAGGAPAASYGDGAGGAPGGYGYGGNSYNNGGGGYGDVAGGASASAASYGDGAGGAPAGSGDGGYGNQSNAGAGYGNSVPDFQLDDSFKDDQFADRRG